MKTKPREDAFKLFIDFKKDVLEQKPSSSQMFEELQMMRFKIRPLQGDVSIINLKDKKLVEILWNLGKLDEFFQKKYWALSASQKKTFFHLFDNLHQQYQLQLNQLNIFKLSSGTELNVNSTIEMEIFKEEQSTKKLN